MTSRRRAAIFVSVLVLSVALDQGSKAWARTLPVPAGCAVPGDLIAQRCGGIPQPVIAGYWDWELAMNDRAAFSSLGGVPQPAFAVIAALALIAIGVAVARTRPEELAPQAAWHSYGLVAGGAARQLDRSRAPGRGSPTSCAGIVHDAHVADLQRRRCGAARGSGAFVPRQCAGAPYKISRPRSSGVDWTHADLVRAPWRSLVARGLHARTMIAFSRSSSAAVPEGAAATAGMRGLRDWMRATPRGP